MFCVKCGKELEEGAKFCSECGYSVNGQVTNVEKTEKEEAEVVDQTISEKSRLVAFLLAFFVGVLGIHNFYLGKKGIGITQLVLTLTVLGSFISAIWAFVEMIIIICGNAGDGNGKFVRKWLD